MNNAKAAIDTLKKALKLAGYTYADVARQLDLSEASVKKMFANYHFTLKRIDQVCELIDMDFIDLVRLFDAQRQCISTLKIEQEQELIRDKRLFLIALCSRNHWTFDEILGSFNFTRVELLQYLRRLEQLQLLELHPNNRIKLRVAEDFRWIPHGPIETFFEQHLLNEFLHANFDQAGDIKLYLHGGLSPTAQASLMQRLNVLAHEFSELQKESVSCPVSEKHNVGLLLALREWEPKIFATQRKSAS